MNSQEKKYVIKRITEIESAKLREANDAVTTPAVTISNQEKLKRFIAGDFKIKDDPETSYYWYKAVDFGEKFPKTNSQKMTKLRQQIKAEADKLRDQVMLGNDNDELLKMITDFNNMEIK